MTKFFKLAAILEGISYILLFANMLFIKPNYPDLYKTLLFPVGMSHGLLFIAYLYLAFLIRERQGWSLSQFSLVLLASLLPFATFYVEKKYVKNV